MSEEAKLQQYFEEKGLEPLAASQLAKVTERDLIIARHVSQEELLAWAEEQAFNIEGYTGKQYSVPVCETMNKHDRRVHDTDYRCCWISPFGFVPECGCPLHDEPPHTAEQLREEER